MKRLFSHMNSALLSAVVFVLFQGQLVFASPASRELEKQIEKAVGHYYTEPFTITASDDGIVKIRGEVPLYYDRLCLFEIIAQVDGVKEIQDDVLVNAPIVSDKMVEANILEKIAMSHMISEPEKIKVEVDNGIVFLNGDVSFYREKLIARSIASWEKGVKGIEDELQIVVDPKNVKSDQDLTLEVQEVLRSRFPHENGISVSVQDGVVTLAGRTRTLWTEDQLVKGLSGVLDVRDVISMLKLGY